MKEFGLATEGRQRAVARVVEWKMGEDGGAHLAHDSAKEGRDNTRVDWSQSHTLIMQLGEEKGAKVRNTVTQYIGYPYTT